MTAAATREGRILVLLAGAVLARMVLYVLYLPAFEGPDEPQHLARALDFARRPFGEAFAGRQVDADVVSATLAYPCPGRGVGCPPYARVPGAFDLLRPPPVVSPSAASIPDEEAKQPPLYYMTAGLLLRAAGASPAPARALLVLRLFDVLLVAIAIFFPLRRLFRGVPGLAVAGLVALLSPGASEAFARCSNDAAVLLWSALVLELLDRAEAPAWIVPLVAAGPLIKMTAVPVAVFAAAALWTARRRALGAAAVAAALAVVPVQALRGWIGGGVVELPRGAPPVVEPASDWALGLARTAWTMLKMPPWAMGWSALRPPLLLSIAWVGLLAAAVGSARLRVPMRRAPAHAVAAAAAGVGTIVFAIALRRYFGVWGGVTGWYVWSWSVWLAVAARDVLTVPPTRARRLLAVEVLLGFAFNAAWLAAAAATYGPMIGSRA